MIQRVIGPMKVDQLPDPKETEADYALVLAYDGPPDYFDPNEYVALVFERRFDYRVTEDGYYWYRMNARSEEEDDEPSLADAFDTKLTPYTSTVTLGDHTFPVGEYRMNPIWSKIKESVEDGDIVAVDPATGAHATLTNFSKDPNDYPVITTDPYVAIITKDERTPGKSAHINVTLAYDDEDGEPKYLPMVQVTAKELAQRASRPEATTADLDARDHYGNEELHPLPTNLEAAAEIWGESCNHYISDEKIHAYRALHPTQEDRIEKKLDELLVIAKKFLGE